MISPNEFTNYDAIATRGQVVSILGNALPADALVKMNEVEDKSIPDVAVGAPYYEKAYQLYRAGILVGDTNHKLLPNDSIKRSEVVAIATRMADPSLRVSVKMEYVPEVEAGRLWTYQETMELDRLIQRFNQDILSASEDLYKVSSTKYNAFEVFYAKSALRYVGFSMFELKKAINLINQKVELKMDDGGSLRDYAQKLYDKLKKMSEMEVTESNFQDMYYQIIIDFGDVLDSTVTIRLFTAKLAYGI